MMLWAWIVPIGGLATLTAGIFWFLGYNKAYMEDATTVQSTIEALWIDQSAVNVAAGLILFEFWMPWMHANMPMDKKDEMKDEDDMMSLYKLIAF